MPNPLDIAPLATWIRVLLAALLIDLGLVAFGHARMVRRAFHGRWGGPLGATRLASSVRWTGITLALAALLTGVELAWPFALNAVLALLIIALLAAELVASTRG